MQPAFNYKFDVPEPRNNKSEIEMKQEKHEIKSKPSITKDENDNTRQIRYYQDRIDFHGEILMKPQAAKSRNLLY
jgi:hypothetical protein